MTIDIKLNNINSIIKLNKEASKFNSPLWVHDYSGNMIDAKSLLGLIPLIGKRCRLVIEDDADPNLLVKVAKKANIRYIKE